MLSKLVTFFFQLVYQKSYPHCLNYRIFFFLVRYWILFSFNSFKSPEKKGIFWSTLQVKKLHEEQFYLLWSLSLNFPQGIRKVLASNKSGRRNWWCLVQPHCRYLCGTRLSAEGHILVCSATGRPAYCKGLFAGKEETWNFSALLSPGSANLFQGGLVGVFLEADLKPH